MDISKITDIPIRDILDFYGVQFNSRGAARCPFHSEKTASFKVHNNHFTCFGCGKHGDAIDFVMEYFGLDFKQAIVRINSDFNLGLTNRAPTIRERKEAAERKQIDLALTRIKAKRMSDYDRLCDAHRALYQYMITYKATWLKPLTDAISASLDDFTGEETRTWMTR